MTDKSLVRQRFEIHQKSSFIESSLANNLKAPKFYAAPTSPNDHEKLPISLNDWQLFKIIYPSGAESWSIFDYNVSDLDNMKYQKNILMKDVENFCEFLFNTANSFQTILGNENEESAKNVYLI